MNRVWSIFFIEEGGWGTRERERERENRAFWRGPTTTTQSPVETLQWRLVIWQGIFRKRIVPVWKCGAFIRSRAMPTRGGWIYTGPGLESAAGPRRPIVCPWVINFRLIEIWCKRRRIVHSLYAEICVAGFEFRRLPLCRGINCPFVYLPGLCNRLLATLDTQ